MKILNIEPACYNEQARGLLEKLSEIDYEECRDPEQLKELLSQKEYDVLMLGLGIFIGSDILAQGQHLKWIVTPTTGLTHIDLASARKQGIEVVSLKGEYEFLENIHATAEHCWALLLSLVRYLPRAHQDVLDGYWRRTPFLGKELKGKTLGIIGCGRLGRKVASFGLTFGMNVCACEISEESKRKTASSVEFVSIDYLLEHSDVVSLHLPCDEQTKGFFKRELIRQMKPGSYFINTARGELVDEVALLEALRSGQILGAGLDVLDDDASWGEKVSNTNPLLEFAREGGNVLLTPHIGGYSQEPVEATRLFVTEKLLEKLND